MPSSPTLVWFRRDLRTADHRALAAAVRRGGGVVCIYIHSPEEEGDWAPGAAARWWLHHSLASLGEKLKQLGSPLILRAGSSAKQLREVARQVGADAIYYNRLYEPRLRHRDTRVADELTEAGWVVRDFAGALLHEPDEIRTGGGGPYKVFTPFWKALQSSLEVSPPLAAPRKLTGPDKAPASLSLDELGLLPQIDWAGGIREHWTPGEQGAAERLRNFTKQGVDAYAERRDEPAGGYISELSPHLHFGEVTPAQVWHAVLGEAGSLKQLSASRESYLRQIAWREFGHHLLYHFPETPTRPLRPEFENFPWKRSEKQLRAWQRGRTGFPIVDAGMRQLWHTGWMHNRVRLIVGSLLVKDLLLSWQEGAEWFWDTLVDADLANNTLGWQWIGGCGADAAPYFRIFNPYTQAERFDPRGEYVRRWVPELAELPDEYIHRPQEAPPLILSAAGIKLGRDYPLPIVDHATARQAALEALETIKQR